jgi:hypothetical protein
MGSREAFEETYARFRRRQQRQSEWRQTAARRVRAHTHFYLKERKRERWYLLMTRICESAVVVVATPLLSCGCSCLCRSLCLSRVPALVPVPALSADPTSQGYALSATQLIVSVLLCVMAFLFSPYSTTTSSAPVDYSELYAFVKSAEFPREVPLQLYHSFIYVSPFFLLSKMSNMPMPLVRTLITSAASSAYLIALCLSSPTSHVLTPTYTVSMLPAIWACRTTPATLFRGPFGILAWFFFLVVIYGMKKTVSVFVIDLRAGHHGNYERLKMRWRCGQYCTWGRCAMETSTQVQTREREVSSGSLPQA